MKTGERGRLSWFVRLVRSMNTEVLMQLLGLRSQLMPRVVIQLHSPVDVAPVSDLHDSDRRLGIIRVWFFRGGRVYGSRVRRASQGVRVRRRCFPTTATVMRGAWSSRGG